MGDPLERVPPQDIPAEQAVLGCCLLDGEAAGEVVARLREQDFYRTAHRIIFKIISEMQMASEPVDELTLRDRLRSAGTMEEIGGSEYIHLLTCAVPSAANLHRYMGIVEEHAKRRRLIELGTKTIRHSEDGMDPATVAAKLSTALEQLPTDAGAWMTSIEVLAEAGDEESFKTGLEALDTMTNGGIMCGLNIFSGLPGAGKTTLGLQIIARALEARHKACIISSDQARSGMLFIMASAHAKRSIDDIKSHMVTDPALDHVLRWPLSWYKKSFHLPYILAEIEGQAKQDVRFFIIDYLGLISTDGDEPAHTRKLVVADALKRIAQELKLYLILISRTTKIAMDKKTGQRSEPDLHHVEGEGGVANAADLILMLHKNPNDDRDVTVFCRKSRQSATGKEQLLFVGNTHRFYDKED